MKKTVKLTLPNLALSGSAFIVIAALLWSLDGVIRSSLNSIPPSFLVSLEHILGIIPLLPWLYIYRKEFFKASRSAQIALVVTSIISGALGTIFYTAALGQINYIPFSVVVLVIQLQPLFTVGLSTFLLKEKLTAKFVVAAIFSLIGVYLISFPNLMPDLSSKAGIAQATAALLALCAAFAWGSGTVFSKITLSEINYKAATAGRYLITIITALLLSFILGQNIVLASITSTQWLELVVLVFVTGTGALLIYYRGLSQTKANASAFLELVWPASAFLIDIIRNVSFTPSQLVGAVLVAMMVYRIAKQQNLLPSRGE